MWSEDWLSARKKAPDPDKCLVTLVRNYIERYGPVSREDIVYRSFLLKSDVDMALASLRKELVKDTFDSTKEYFSIEEDPRTTDSPGVIILPEFDSLMMGYRDKSRFLSHDRVNKVFWGLGGINRTILLDGFVSATWKRKIERKGRIVTVKPLRAR